MKQVFLKKEGTPVLTLFFAGWGMDEHPFMHLPFSTDVLMCYDYTTPDFDVQLLDGYQEIRLVAWSMGVWQAACVWQNLGLPVTHAIAFNGTPTPVHASMGIAPEIAVPTCERLDQRNLDKFRRRMCGSVAYAAFMQNAPVRSVEDLKTELGAIITRSLQLPVPQCPWNMAWIGKGDLIFLPQAQHLAWQTENVPYVDVDVAHYDAQLLQQLLTVFSWTNN